MNDSSKVWYTQGWKDKIASGFTVSASQNGDKLNKKEADKFLPNFIINFRN